MAENFPQQPAGQMPEIFGPHLLDRVALGELREDGVDAVAKPSQEGTPFWSLISLVAAVRRDESMPALANSSLVLDEW